MTTETSLAVTTDVVATEHVIRSTARNIDLIAEALGMRESQW